MGIACRLQENARGRQIGALVAYLQDHRAIRRLVGTSDAGQLSLALTRCQEAAEQKQATNYHRRTKVTVLITRVDLGVDAITISLSPEGFADLIGSPFDPERLPRLTARITRMRKGCEIKLVLTDEATSERDDTLVALLREAISTLDEVLADPTRGISQLATATGRCSKRMTRLVRLSWFASEIVAAILAGRQPTTLRPRSLLSFELPMGWAGQKAALGF